MKEMELNGYMCGYHTRLEKIAAMDKQATPEWVTKALEKGQELGGKAYEKAKEYTKRGVTAAKTMYDEHPKATKAIAAGSAAAGAAAGFVASRKKKKDEGQEKSAALMQDAGALADKGVAKGRDLIRQAAHILANHPKIAGGLAVGSAAAGAAAGFGAGKATDKKKKAQE